MLRIGQRQSSVCQGITRRSLLQAGGAGLLGLSLPQVLQAREIAGAAARAKSVIFLFLFGGPSQLETFDLKPEAADAIRGPYKPIACRTPGMLMGEKLPRLAALSDKFCVLRTLSHSYNDHSGGGHYIQTGHRWPIPIGGGFNATPQDWPSIGAVADYVRRQQQGGLGDVPNAMVVPNSLGRLQTYSVQLKRPGEYAGWLGRGYDPVTTRIEKRNDKDNPYFRECTDEELNYQIENLQTPEAVSLQRLGRRQSLLQEFDAQRRLVDQGGSISAFDRFQQRALALVTSEKIRTALDIRQESAGLRDRYGRHLFGQSTLLARRLVEAGVGFVTVHWDCPDGYSWDSHVNSKDVGDHLLPGLDQTLSALLEDLEQRGLLDETLVVALGEMGRTPKANANWGRDHWSTLFPAVLAGAGIRGGIVIGESDRDAAYALSPPFAPEDLAATIYHALGIDPELRVLDAQNRPVQLTEGRVIGEVWG